MSFNRGSSPFSNPLSRSMLRDMAEFSGFAGVKPPKKTNIPKIKVKPKKKVTPVKKVAIKKVAVKKTPVKKVVAPKPKVSKPINKPVKTAPKKAVKVKKITSTSQIPVGSNGVIVKQAPNEVPVVVAQKGSGIGDKLFSLASQVVASMGNRETIQTVNDVPVYNPSQSESQYETTYGGGGRGRVVNSDGTVTGNLESTANTVSSGVGGLFEWGRENLGLVAVAGIGLALWLKESPRSRK